MGGEDDEGAADHDVESGDGGMGFVCPRLRERQRRRR
jgi:hypothetical protein